VSRNRFFIDVLLVLLFASLTPSLSFAGKEGALTRAFSTFVSRTSRTAPRLTPPKSSFRSYSTDLLQNSHPPLAPSKTIRVAVVERAFGDHRVLKNKIVEPGNLRTKNERQRMMMESEFGPEYLEMLRKSKLHGTAVAGLVSKGVDNLEILPVSSFIDFSSLKAACEAGVSLVNISSFIKDPAMFQELGEIIQEYKNVLFILSAGNDGKNLDWYSRYDSSFSFSNLIFVAAAENHPYTKDSFPPSDAPSLELASFSNYGKNSVHLATVGQDLPLLAPDNHFSTGSGTSYSAPLTANLCIKMERINPSLTAQEKIQILKETLFKTNALRKKLIWGGVLNREAALRMAEARKAVSEKSDKNLMVRENPNNGLVISPSATSSSAN